MFKAVFKKWVAAVGPLEAKSRLARRGLGMSTIDQMVSDNYAHDPRGTNRVVILEEMAKDGFTLGSDEVA